MNVILRLSSALYRRLELAKGKAPPWIRHLLHSCDKALHISLADCGRGNIVAIEPGLFRGIAVTFVGSANRVEIGANCTVKDLTITICGSNNAIRIGERGAMGGGWLEIYGDDSTVDFEAACSAVRVSVHVTDSGSSVSVGTGTMLGPDCKLRCGDGHAIYDRFTGEIINRAHFLSIGREVWAGAEVVFLKDVTVGEGAIIGTRAVVTKSLPERCLAAGIPAKVIRTNVGWTRQKIDDLTSDWFASTFNDGASVCPT